MEWSAEIAALEMWKGLDLTETNGEVRAYFKRCLQDAFTAGYCKGCSAAEYDDTNTRAAIVAGMEVDVWDDRDPVERKTVVFVCEHVVILEDGSYYLPPFDKLRPSECAPS